MFLGVGGRCNELTKSSPARHRYQTAHRTARHIDLVQTIDVFHRKWRKIQSMLVPQEELGKQPNWAVANR